MLIRHRKGVIIKIKTAPPPSLEQATRLYDASCPILPNHPSNITPILHGLCDRLEIPPIELRVYHTRGPYLHASTRMDSIIVGDEFLESLSASMQKAPSQATLLIKGLLGHEISHIVHGDTIPSKASERRADRFAHFAAGETSARMLAALIHSHGNQTSEEVQTHYGTTEERIAQLLQPVMAHEAREFQRAANRYRHLCAGESLG